MSTLYCVATLARVSDVRDFSFHCGYFVYFQGVRSSSLPKAQTMRELGIKDSFDLSLVVNKLVSVHIEYALRLLMKPI